jgi:hypothetical protein
MRDRNGPIHVRLRFWGRAVSLGSRWAWNVLDQATRAVAVIALLIVSIGGGLLLHRPTPVIVGVAVILVVFSFAEGAYQQWAEAGEDLSSGLAAVAVELTLVDRLRLAVKHGWAIHEQVRLGPPDSSAITQARQWHDGVYATLIEGCASNEAQRWLDETDHVPGGSIVYQALAREVLEGQINCLGRIIESLETE